MFKFGAWGGDLCIWGPGLFCRVKFAEFLPTNYSEEPKIVVILQSSALPPEQTFGGGVTIAKIIQMIHRPGIFGTSKLKIFLFLAKNQKEKIMLERFFG